MFDASHLDEALSKFIIHSLKLFSLTLKELETKIVTKKSLITKMVKFYGVFSETDLGLLQHRRWSSLQ